MIYWIYGMACFAIAGVASIIAGVWLIAYAVRLHNGGQLGEPLPWDDD